MTHQNKNSRNKNPSNQPRRRRQPSEFWSITSSERILAQSSIIIVSLVYLFVHFSSLPSRRFVNLNQFSVDTWSVQAHRLDASVLLIIIASCENLREFWNFSTHLNSTSPSSLSFSLRSFYRSQIAMMLQHMSIGIISSTNSMTKITMRGKENYTEVPQPVSHFKITSKMFEIIDRSSHSSRFSKVEDHIRGES